MLLCPQMANATAHVVALQMSLVSAKRCRLTHACFYLGFTLGYHCCFSNVVIIYGNCESSQVLTDLPERPAFPLPFTGGPALC